MPFGATLTYEQDTKDAHKARGAFFTPKELAEQLVVAAIEGPFARVFEPSCGEACFLEQAALRLRALGASDSQVSEQRFGCELHEESAAAARRLLLASFATVEVTMFEERVFPEVQEEVVLLVARKRGDACDGHIDLCRMEGLGAAKLCTAAA